MRVLVAFDRNGQEEPGWHWKRAESFPNSCVFVLYAADVIFLGCLPQCQRECLSPTPCSGKDISSMLMKERGHTVSDLFALL